LAEGFSDFELLEPMFDSKFVFWLCDQQQNMATSQSNSIEERESNGRKASTFTCGHI
jgi:hypothetical protein